MYVRYLFMNVMYVCMYVMCARAYVCRECMHACDACDVCNVMYVCDMYACFFYGNYVGNQI